MKYWWIPFIILAAHAGIAQIPDSAYVQEIDRWHAQRIASLTRPDGWLSLVGLYWLRPGENTFGSDSTNTIVFPPKAPKRMGRFILQDTTVVVEILPGIPVTVNGQPVSRMPLQHDLTGHPTILQYKSLLWYIIKRGNQLGVRLKDTLATTRLHFKGIERYPVDPRWRIPARFVPFPQKRFIEIPTVLGTIVPEPSPGQLVFTVNGQEYRLDVIQEQPGDPYFVIFSDETNGEETYGAGRFLYVAPADSTGWTVIDFNKAYNPPCAFTPYATCPLPPPQNHLPLPVRAGEKRYESEYAH